MPAKGHILQDHHRYRLHPRAGEEDTREQSLSSAKFNDTKRAVHSFPEGLALGQLAESMLFQMTGFEPIVVTAGIAIHTVVVLVSGWLPAYRASQVDPNRAVREF